MFFFLQEIEPTPCPLGCGLEFKNPTSLDVHLKNVHSVTKQQIKQAQKIPMANPKDFLLVLAQDNVMCFTAGGCNTKLSCLSSARRHYNKRHPQTGSGLLTSKSFWVSSALKCSMCRWHCMQ